MSPLHFVLIVLWLMRASLLVAIAVLLVALLLHTLEELGRNTSLYKRRRPVPGWSGRFYPACIALIILMGILVWLIATRGERFFTDNLL